MSNGQNAQKDSTQRTSITTLDDSTTVEAHMLDIYSWCLSWFVKAFFKFVYRVRSCFLTVYVQLNIHDKVIRIVGCTVVTVLCWSISHL